MSSYHFAHLTGLALSAAGRAPSLPSHAVPSHAVPSHAVRRWNGGHVYGWTEIWLCTPSAPGFALGFSDYVPGVGGRRTPAWRWLSLAVPGVLCLVGPVGRSPSRRHGGGLQHPIAPEGAPQQGAGLGCVWPMLISPCCCRLGRVGREIQAHGVFGGCYWVW